MKLILDSQGFGINSFWNQLPAQKSQKESLVEHFLKEPPSLTVKNIFLFKEPFLAIKNLLWSGKIHWILKVVRGTINAYKETFKSAKKKQ